MKTDDIIDGKSSVWNVQTVRVDLRARPAAAGPSRRPAVGGLVLGGGFPDALRIERAPASRFTRSFNARPMKGAGSDCPRSTRSPIRLSQADTVAAPR